MKPAAAEVHRVFSLRCRHTRMHVAHQLEPTLGRIPPQAETPAVPQDQHRRFMHIAAAVHLLRPIPRQRSTSHALQTVPQRTRPQGRRFFTYMRLFGNKEGKRPHRLASSTLQAPPPFGRRASSYFTTPSLYPLMLRRYAWLPCMPRQHLSYRMARTKW